MDDPNTYKMTQQSTGYNPRSLKSKMGNLEIHIEGLGKEITKIKKEVELLKSDKETLHAYLDMKTADVKESIQNELQKIEKEMVTHFVHEEVVFC